MEPVPQSAPQPRAVFFDEDAARAALLRLQTEGWEAELRRDRFQGEDDDEDHPWIVTSEAPVLLLELLVDEYDGWLDEQAPPGSFPSAPSSLSPPPLDLPAAPKRVKRPDLHPDLHSDE